MPEATGTITLDDLAGIMALTAHQDAPAAFRGIDRLAKRVFDHALFTVTRSLHETKEVERAYSSNPGAYPVGGRKRKADTEWGARVLDRGEVLVCRDASDIRRVFADHALILSLGINSMINVPVLLAGRSVATMNISHADAGRFREEDLPAMTTLAGLLLPLVLAGRTG